MTWSGVLDKDTLAEKGKILKIYLDIIQTFSFHPRISYYTGWWDYKVCSLVSCSFTRKQMSLSRQNTGGAVSDPAFANAGKVAGLEVWRIKKFQVARVNKSEYGYFYDGDCYIVLHTKANNRWNVHFWLGNDSTIDEQGTAAIKTVELDEFLGGGPVQYREVQEYESPLFISYFKNGIKYMKGGHESGFRKVSETTKREPRLFCCKGKRNVRCKQVKVSRDSLNLGDVFILDNWNDIYVWCPPESGRLEKNKGIQVATDIKDQDHSGRGNIHILDQNWNLHETFWNLLGGKGPVKPASMGGSDDEQHKIDKQLISLYKVSDATGKMTIKKIADGELLTTMLDSNDCFILDAANSGIFVWIGKKGTAEERKNSMQWASKYIEMQKKPPWTPVVRVLDDAEPSVFLQWFKDAEGAKHKKFKPRLYQCSDESGKAVVEEVCNFQQEELDGDDVMILDAGPIVYVWIGSQANDKETKHARKTAQTYIDTTAVPRPPGASIMTIQQGKEPSEFTKLFPKWDKNLWPTAVKKA